MKAIQINDKYRLESDDLQYILSKKFINKKGEEKYKPIAFANKLEQIATYLYEQSIKDNLELLENLNKCIAMKKDLEKKLESV